MAVVGRRQALHVQPAATMVSTMDASALSDLHGTIGARDDEIFDVVASGWNILQVIVDVAQFFATSHSACSTGLLKAISMELEMKIRAI